MRSILIKWIFGSVLLAVQISSATETPLWTGLPDTLPMDFVDREVMVGFQQTAETFHAPLAAAIVFNQKPVSNGDRETLGTVFSEFFFARLPSKMQIRIQQNSTRQQIWDYPVGTIIVHLLVFNTQVPQIFELRLEQKMSNGQWAFGIYTPGVKGLQLNRYQGVRADAYTLQLASGQSVAVSLSHINTQSCRMCHFANSPSKYQYPSPGLAGPCGFGPANGALVTDWATRYFQAHKEQPFNISSPGFFRRR